MRLMELAQASDGYLYWATEDFMYSTGSEFTQPDAEIFYETITQCSELYRQYLKHDLLTLAPGRNIRGVPCLVIVNHPDGFATVYQLQDKFACITFDYQIKALFFDFIEHEIPVGIYSLEEVSFGNQQNSESIEALAHHTIYLITAPYFDRERFFNLFWKQGVRLDSTEIPEVMEREFMDQVRQDSETIEWPNIEDLDPKDFSDGN